MDYIQVIIWAHQCVKWQKWSLNYSRSWHVYILWERYKRWNFGKANNKYLKAYDPKQELKSIVHLDANNLYGYPMSKFISTSGFKWINPKEFGLNKSTSNSSNGFVLEVELEYRKKIRELRNGYPLAPDKIEIKREILFEYQLKIADLYVILVILKN